VAEKWGAARRALPLIPLYERGCEFRSTLLALRCLRPSVVSHTTSRYFPAGWLGLRCGDIPAPLTVSAVVEWTLPHVKSCATPATPSWPPRRRSRGARDWARVAARRVLVERAQYKPSRCGYSVAPDDPPRGAGRPVIHA
jgi:hypothetical protein